MILENQCALFDLDAEICFMNGAYMSPQLLAVEKAGSQAIRKLAKPYLYSTEDFFIQSQEIKSVFSRLINAENSNDIAIIPSVSYGIASVANNINLSIGDEIIVLKDQFPSNYYTWKRKADQAGAKVVTVDGSPNTNRGHSWNQNILDAINERTKLVAISQVHWAEGIIYDLEKIRCKTDQFNAWLIVDGTQSVGAFPFDVSKVRPDALICAGYKWLMGPYGTALAYYGPKMKGGIPIEENWINRKDSYQFQNLVNYQESYVEGQGRYSMGQQSNFILLPMLLEALKQIEQWGTENIQSYCKSLNEPYLDKLRELGFVVLGNGQLSNHLLGVQMPSDIDENRLKEAYADNMIYVSFRGNAIRISPNVYNDASDWERLLDVTAAALL